MKVGPVPYFSWSKPLSNTAISCRSKGIEIVRCQNRLHERVAIDRVIDFPNSWPQYSYRPRRCLCNRFPFSVIYRHTDTELTIYAVAHQKRKPGYWKNRLR